MKKISVPECLNIKGAPVIGGLYDPAMGPINDNESYVFCLIFCYLLTFSFLDVPCFYMLIFIESFNVDGNSHTVSSDDRL